MAGKKRPTKPTNITIRLTVEDRKLFDDASHAEHFDTLSQWMKVTLRKRASDVLSESRANERNTE